MPEPTGPPATTDSPPREPAQFAYCSWHKGYAWDTRLVQQPDDQGSSFGVPGLFACKPCRKKRKLRPLADQPAA